MERAKSISVDQLNEAAIAAAKSVLGDNLKRFGGGASVGIIPDLGTVGIIWRDPDFGSLNAGDLLDISTKIAGEMRSVAGDVRPVAKIFEGGVTAGYFPNGPILTQKLF